MRLNMDVKTRSVPIPLSDISSDAQGEAFDAGKIRPWRIALVLKRTQVKLIVDLISTYAIGRFDLEGNASPDIDLSPFSAEEFGVSRRHLLIKLENDVVVVVDNESSNGTRLNGQRLEPGRSYPVRHADEIVLGAMEIEIELLMNPLD
jgi:pSer/pThr/pTyr-binding forkhead associated (FHA) protein